MFKFIYFCAHRIPLAFIVLAARVLGYHDGKGTYPNTGAEVLLPIEDNLVTTTSAVWRSLARWIERVRFGTSAVDLSFCHVTHHQAMCTCHPFPLQNHEILSSLSVLTLPVPD